MSILIAMTNDVGGWQYIIVSGGDGYGLWLIVTIITIACADCKHWLVVVMSYYNDR